MVLTSASHSAQKDRSTRAFAKAAGAGLDSRFTVAEAVFAFMKKRSRIPGPLGFAALVVVAPALGVERLAYQLLEDRGAYELRQYDDHHLATTEIAADFERAGNQAFRPLFNYIDGRNATGESISMTAPVTQQRTDAGYEIAFVMPQTLDGDALPAPKSEQVKVVARQGRLMAARSYRGNWSEHRYAEEEAALRTALADSGLALCAEPVWARFDPPFMPSFWRTNEILIEVARDTCDGSPASP